TEFRKKMKSAFSEGLWSASDLCAWLGPGRLQVGQQVPKTAGMRYRDTERLDRFPNCGDSLLHLVISRVNIVALWIPDITSQIADRIHIWMTFNQLLKNGPWSAVSGNKFDTFGFSLHCVIVRVEREPKRPLTNPIES